jgi:hypothetical protein
MIMSSKRLPCAGSYRKGAEPVISQVTGALPFNATVTNKALFGPRLLLKSVSLKVSIPAVMVEKENV